MAQGDTGHSSTFAEGFPRHLRQKLGGLTVSPLSAYPYLWAWRDRDEEVGGRKEKNKEKGNVQVEGVK